MLRHETSAYGPKRSRRHKLLLICIDGGLLEIVRLLDLFSTTSLGLDLNDSGPRSLATAYPSSTAPSHASILSGLDPVVHGVLGNDYPRRCETFGDAPRTPLSNLYAYSRDTIRSTTIIDDMESAGLKWAGIHFPAAFTRADSSRGSLVLYAPPRVRPLCPEWSETYFGFDLKFRLTDVGPNATCETPAGPLSLALQIDEERGVVCLGRAALVLGANYSAAEATAATLPHPNASVLSSAEPCSVYDANEDVPTPQWITAQAAAAASISDVVLLRYNHCDHAQEALYGGTSGVHTSARRLGSLDRILDTYLIVEDEIRRLVHLTEPESIILLSDHGIARRRYLYRPNVLLADRQSNSRFFGDSNISYLTGNETDERIEAALASCPMPFPVSWRRRTEWGWPTIEVPADVEIAYDGGAVVEEVWGGSHGGKAAEEPTLDGFIRYLGPYQGALPTRVADVRAFVRMLMTQC